MQTFLLKKKCEKLLHCKSFSIFFNKIYLHVDYEVVKYLASWLFNELVKLTLFEQLGPGVLIRIDVLIQYTEQTFRDSGQSSTYKMINMGGQTSDYLNHEKLFE